MRTSPSHEAARRVDQLRPILVRLALGLAVLLTLSALTAEAWARLRVRAGDKVVGEDTGLDAALRGPGEGVAFEPLPTPTAEEEALWAAPRFTVQLSPRCPDLEACSHHREVPLEARAAGLPVQAAVLGYDLHEVTRAVAPEAIARESELSIAVRLVLAEVGADRLLSNRWGLVEATGVLRSVRNRLDPAVYNPDGHVDLRPYPGCGPTGSFASCARPSEYLGLRSALALHPGAAWPEPLLVAAVDRAVLAYWLEGQGQLGDPTGGATRFEHRCGGRRYGEEMARCAQTGGVGAVTGPLVFLGPDRFAADRGYYTVAETARVEFESWWGRRTRGSRAAEGMARLSAALGPPQDAAVSSRLARALGLARR
jgi:hypothetical protein